MRNIKYSLVVLSLLAGCVQASENLGAISVESSTIDVKTDIKTEVSNVNVIDEEAIEVVDPKNFAELLKTIPGVTAVQRSGEMFQIRFRGVGNQQFMGEKPGVAIIIDGVPIMSQAGGFRINMDDIKSVKVIKGAASYLYGDTALSGAVVITTKKQSNNDESYLNAEFGSYGYKNYLVGTTQSFENFLINLNGNYRFSDGYWTESQTWTKSLNGKVTYYIDDSSDITFGADNTDKYDEGGSRSSISGETAAIENPRGESDNSYTKDSGIELDKYYLTYEKEFENNSNFMISSYYYKDWYDVTSNPQDTDSDPSTPNVYVSESQTNLTQRGVKAEYSTTSELLATLTGIEYGQRDYESLRKTLADYSAYSYTTRSDENYYAGETSDTNSKEEIKAVYGEIKYNIDPKLTFVANARYNNQEKEYITEKYDYDGSTWSNITESQKASFHNTAYRIGAVYENTKEMTIFANISTGYETPDIGDLEDNPDIKDQTSINFEIGVRGEKTFQNNSLNYELALYQLNNKDIIGPMGGTYTFGDPMDNIGDSRSRGLELSLKSDQNKTWSFNMAYTFLDAIYTKHNPHEVMLQDRSTVVYDIVGNEIPRVSKHTLDMFINYKATPNLKFITEIYAKSDYWADETNQVKMAGYALVNLQARYNTTLNGYKVEFFGKIDNLFDNQYYRSAFLHRDKRGDVGLDREDISLTVDPGRVYYIGMNLKF